MGLYTTLPAHFPEEVDVIIAGGGTAGCVVAGRLAEADPGLSVLVIEGGADNANFPTVAHPAFLALNLVPATGTALFYKGNKSEHLGGREPVVAAGGVLGGGSSINFMMYTRPQRCDLDAWDMPGWSADELMPYFKKFETYHGQGDAAVHGADGPVHVSDGGFRCEAFESAFNEGYRRLGFKEYKDLQDFDSNNGYAQWNRYVSPEGKRQDAATTYIHPKLASGKYPNLHVLVQSKITRVLLDDNKVAYGVEWIPNPDYQLAAPNTQPPAKKCVTRAKKMVVVSCGACGTPGVLERSGIGNPKILERAKVPLVIDLPGVGHDYQDHHLTLYPFRTSLNEHQTVNRFNSGRISVEECVTEGSKTLGWNCIDIAAKLRPTDAEVAALSPAFQKAWEKDFADAPNRTSMVVVPLSIQLINVVPDPPAEVITAANFTTHPYSRGHIHITGPEVTDPLDFETGFLSDAGGVDCEHQVWAYKKHRELMRRTHIYRGELAEGHPRFPPGSKALPIVVDSWDPDGVADIEYSADDDKAIAEYMRETVSTTWHSLGTAKMAPREKMGVVDEKLNVYGTKGLKIADLSVPPVNVGANTNSLALMVGERAADIIIKELSLGA